MPSIDVASANHKARHATGGPDALTPADIGAVPASRWLTGTGSPEGVVTAPVGTTYTDTAATLGAIEWTKWTGAGNTGWRVTKGDTGPKRLDSLLTNGWTAVAPTNYGPWVRRSGNVVTLSGYVNWSSRTGTAFLTLPLGYRPERITFGHIDTANAEQGALVSVATTGVLEAPYISTVSTTITSGFLTATLITSDPWPTA